MTTETATVTNTTGSDEEDTAESDANESQHSATHAQPRPETARALLVAAALGAFTINWK